MLVEKLDGRGVDDLPKAQAMLECVPLQPLDRGWDEVDGFAHLNRARSFALYERCRRNGAASRRHGSIHIMKCLRQNVGKDNKTQFVSNQWQNYDQFGSFQKLGV